MKDKDLFFKMVQGQIGYTFQNIDLLHQAFVRRSFSEEHGGQNNEVLEFIGDKALDFAVVRLLVQKYGRLANGDPIDGTKLSAWELEFKRQRESAAGTTPKVNEFICEHSEGQLTKIKSRMVEKKTLARRIDELGFSEGLVMGNSDIQNSVQEEPSVKEDLFEAIVGAVALDSGWDFGKIQSVVEVMIEPDSFLQTDEDTNYVRLIQEWEMQKNGVIPFYQYREANYTSSWYMPFNGISENPPMSDYSKLNFHCYLKLLNDLPIFRAFGTSKSEARMAVCKLAYKYLQDHKLLFTIRDEIENPNKAEAINQLEILARRGYFSIPTYNFKQGYDKDGNPIWECECHIAEYSTYFSAKSSSKKDAKKSAAFKMLRHVLSEENAR